MTIFGWDMSHHDGPDSRRAVAEGFSFFTHKAGGDSNDAEVAAWWGLMKPYRDRVLLGAYWVLYPGNPRYRADLFLSRLDATCPGWRDGPFMLQVDCEKWNGDAGTMPPRADIEAFCDRLADRMPKLRPIVYAPEWAYGGSLKGLSYPLWASSYVSGSGAASALYPGDNSSRWDAYSGQTPAILQFTSSATIAGQTTCDANAYRGSLTQLTALVAPGWEQDMPVTNDDAIKMWNTDHSIPMPSWRPDKATNPDIMGASAMVIAMDEAHAANVAATALKSQLTALGASLTAAITALAAKDTVDETALAAALGPAVGAVVLAGLPQGSDPISQEEVTAAVTAAFAKAFSATPSPAAPA